MRISVTSAKPPIVNGHGAKATIDEPTVVGVPAQVTATLRAAASDDLAAFGAQIPQTGCGTTCGGCAGECSTPTFQAQWISGRADQYVVSGRWVFTTYFPGGAHPYDAYQSLIVDAHSGYAIDVTSLFAGGSLKPLADAATPLLKSAVNGRDGCGISGDAIAQNAFNLGVAPKPDNYEAVAVVASGLAVAIEPGQISSEACGGFNVTVPWSSIRSALSALGSAIADNDALPAAAASSAEASSRATA